MVPDRVFHLCILELAWPVLIYLSFLHLQICHTYPHKCPDGPCLPPIDSECLRPFLLVTLLSIDTLLRAQKTWMALKGGIFKAGIQSLHAHPSKEGGGRARMESNAVTTVRTTVRMLISTRTATKSCSYFCTTRTVLRVQLRAKNKTRRYECNLCFSKIRDCPVKTVWTCSVFAVMLYIWWCVDYVPVSNSDSWRWKQKQSLYFCLWKSEKSIIHRTYPFGILLFSRICFYRTHV